MQFYAELYCKENEELSAKFYDGLTKITQDSVVKIDKPLTEQDLLSGLKRYNDW